MVKRSKTKRRGSRAKSHEVKIREWDPVPGCHGWFPDLVPTVAAFGAGYLNPDRFLTGHVAYSRKDAIL